MNASTIFLRGLFGRCLHCGKGRIFSGIYAIHPECSVCGLRFANMPGDFTGAAYINSALTGAIAVAFGVLAVFFTDISVFTLMLLGIPLILLTATLFHKPIR